MFKFIIVGLGSGVLVSIASLVWPRLTVQPRPAPLEKVREIVIQTEIGKNAAEILGVASPSSVTRINPSQIARTAVESVVTTVEKRAQEVVVENAVKQLSNQFNGLPQEQKQQIQSVICKPQ